MFHDNLASLRKLHHMTQEELSEKVGVSRQALAKWELGETTPDVMKAKQLAEVFDVSLDDLMNYDPGQTGLALPPKGKHIFGVVKVGEKGQIVIPQRARKIFDIAPGDRLIVLGDESQGLALIKEDGFLKIMDAIRKAE